MLIFLAVCLSITLWRIGFAKRDEIFEDCLSKDKTNSIRGAFIILVFFSHFTSYIQNFNILDQYEKTLLALISQRMVTMFLLYSGYGIMESIKKKGKSYVNGIPLKRIGKVLLQFDIAVFLFILVKCIIGQASSLSVKLVLLSLIGWKSVGNSNWYVFAVIIAYFAAFIGFKLTKSHAGGIAVTTGLILIYCFLMHFLTSQGLRWYDTILCFPLGMVLSECKDKAFRIYRFRPLWWGSVLALIAFQAISIKYAGSILLRIAAMITFSILVFLITMRVSVDNPALRYLGSHLFGLFIMQRVPMILVKQYGLFGVSNYLCLGICILTTIPLAIGFDWLTGKCWTLLTSGKRKKNTVS